MAQIGLPAQCVVQLLHLAEKRFRCNAQTDDRYPQDAFTCDDTMVLSQRVVDRIERKRVVAAVNLDHEPHIVPTHIEIDPTLWSPANSLPRGGGQPDLPRHASEVELAE